MVLAEKIVTAVARGSANTRWRDFVDIHALVRRHDIDGKTLRESLERVAKHREVELAPLRVVLADYASLAQRRWDLLERELVSLPIQRGDDRVEAQEVADQRQMFAVPREFRLRECTDHDGAEFGDIAHVNDTLGRGWSAMIISTPTCQCVCVRFLLTEHSKGCEVAEIDGYFVIQGAVTTANNGGEQLKVA
jgi:hypothetical protein